MLELIPLSDPHAFSFARYMPYAADNQPRAVTALVAF